MNATTTKFSELHDAVEDARIEVLAAQNDLLVTMRSATLLTGLAEIVRDQRALDVANDNLQNALLALYTEGLRLANASR